MSSTVLRAWTAADERAAIRRVPPVLGKKKLRVPSDNGGFALYGRNMLISRVILRLTGQTRLRKQISSHNQVMWNFPRKLPYARYVGSLDTGDKDSRYVRLYDTSQLAWDEENCRIVLHGQSAGETIPVPGLTLDSQPPSLWVPAFPQSQPSMSLAEDVWGSGCGLVATCASTGSQDSGYCSDPVSRSAEDLFSEADAPMLGGLQLPGSGDACGCDTFGNSFTGNALHLCGLNESFPDATTSMFTAPQDAYFGAPAFSMCSCTHELARSPSPPQKYAGCASMFGNRPWESQAEHPFGNDAVMLSIHAPQHMYAVGAPELSILDAPEGSLGLSAGSTAGAVAEDDGVLQTTMGPDRSNEHDMEKHLSAHGGEPLNHLATDHNACYQISPDQLAVWVADNNPALSERLFPELNEAFGQPA